MNKNNPTQIHHLGISDQLTSKLDSTCFKQIIKMFLVKDKESEYWKTFLKMVQNQKGN